MLFWDTVSNVGLLVLLVHLTLKLRRVDRQLQHYIGGFQSLAWEVGQLKRRLDHPAKVAEVTKLMKERT